jgi:hypothetical protein
MRMLRILTISGFKVTLCSLDNTFLSFMANSTDISHISSFFKIHIKCHNLISVTESHKGYKWYRISWQRWLKMFWNVAKSPAMQQELWDYLGWGWDAAVIQLNVTADHTLPLLPCSLHAFNVWCYAKEIVLCFQ